MFHRSFTDLRTEGLTMFSPILVPLDGSPHTECVLPHVIAMGQVFDSEIILLQVLDKNQANVSTQFIDLLDWQINKTEAMLYLKRIDNQLQNSALQTKINILEGLAAESIIEFARSQQMKLIILNSRGQSGLISSITHKIIFSAPTSVLIVRAPLAKEQQPCRRILVPLGGSWRAENVLPIVTLLARFHKSQIQIVHMVKTPEMARHLPPVQEDIDLSNRIVERNREEALHYLDQVRLHSPLVGIDVKTHLIVSNNVTQAIHELADREQIDMVVLSAHGYSGNNQWPYGNMVNNFILYGKVPLLIVQDLPVKSLQEETNRVDIRVREYVEH
jgi:nucleotide-binding universal stress UspA family protein